MKHIVDISDGKITDKIEDELMTSSLGSCIGVTVYDGTSKIGGMLHFQLPSSRLKGASKDKIAAGAKPRNFRLRIKDGQVEVQSQGETIIL